MQTDHGTQPRDVDLLRVEMATLWDTDRQGRLRGGHHLVMGVAEDGRTTAVGEEVPPALADQVLDLASRGDDHVDPGHRGRGHAASVTAHWATEFAEDRRRLFYSTSAENTSSQRVAARLGLRRLGWIWKLSRPGAQWTHAHRVWPSTGHGHGGRRGPWSTRGQESGETCGRSVHGEAAAPQR
ncbi:GNAT family N-acetyltransferase [Marinactinospora rubrisoli]|uniref:GNAT family N-acetyltransferase n=1 Tax=Marinactinospora rubrisoli TaxID=2715399 RepID=A0ABW2KFF0_9ACTN